MKMAAAQPSSWEELPADLLGQVLLQLPSLADRARLRTVCSPWRANAAAKRHPRLPPPLPWLAQGDGSLVDLHGASVRCEPILREGVSSYLAVDNLAFLVHDDGGCSLMNPLSGLTLPLPNLAPAVCSVINESELFHQSSIPKAHVKVILSSPLDSTLNPLVAVIILDGKGVAISACKQHDAISISIGSDPERTWGLARFRAADIAFLHGKLYALTQSEGLHVIDLDAGHLSEPKSKSGFHQCITGNPTQQQVYFFGTESNPGFTVSKEIEPGDLVMRYLAESDGRLLMIRRWMRFPRISLMGNEDVTFQFEVFEADLATEHGRWMKVDSLGGQAIFLGSECTKSVLASQCAGGVQEDCIYFMHRYSDSRSRNGSGPCADPLGDSGVYNMRDGKIMPLLPEAVLAVLRRKSQFMTWFFPADA